jgi:hypothetical protein
MGSYPPGVHSKNVFLNASGTFAFVILTELVCFVNDGVK